MFGLYGDLPPAAKAENDVKTTGWGSSLKPPRKITTNLAPPPAVIRRQGQPQAVTIRPAVTGDSGAPSQSSGASDITASVVSASGSLSAAVQEEYDPARPNNYEDVRRQRELRRKAAELEEKRKQLEERRKEAEARRRESEAASSSATLDISGEEAYLRRAAMSGAAPEGGAQGDSAAAPSRPGGGMSLAERMMKNMGWKEGQGLGKDGQGIATPLMVKKVGKGAGEIVAAQPLPGPPEKKQKTVPLNSPPTRVLLMRNMVGPGEVDEDLEEEVAKECEKHGPVVRCLIFEITDPNCPSEEAVRIFVQFTKADSAMKALLEMNGRFFGGRAVTASFYDEARFEANDLLTAS